MDVKSGLETDVVLLINLHPPSLLTLGCLLRISIAFNSRRSLSLPLSSCSNGRRWCLSTKNPSVDKWCEKRVHACRHHFSVLSAVMRTQSLNAFIALLSLHMHLDNVPQSDLLLVFWFFQRTIHHTLLQDIESTTFFSMHWPSLRLASQAWHSHSLRGIVLWWSRTIFLTYRLKQAYQLVRFVCRT